MKHQQFETWILLETKLSIEQSRELHQHLRICSKCRRLAQSQRAITHLFATVPTPAPEPGFTNRWHDRLARAETRKKNRIIWGTLSVLTLAFFLTLVGFSLEVVSVSEYIPQFLAIFISQAARWFNLVTSLQNIFSPILRVGIKLIPQSWIIALIIGLSTIPFAGVVAISKNRSNLYTT